MRVAGYIRVSSRDQIENSSLDAQRRAIVEYCARQGWPPPEVFAEEGRSAFTEELARRPAFAALVAAVEARRFAVVVVLDLDRFARSTLTALVAKARLERAGCAIVSLNQGVDFSTPDGGLLFTINSGFAEYFSEQLSRKVLAGIAEKRRRGEHVGGLPFGARRVAGQLEIDPAYAATLRLIYTLAATQSDGRVAQTLNERGIPPWRARGWENTTIRSMRLVTGAWLREQGGDWPALYEAARGRPYLPRLPRGKALLLLSGLLRCPCGARMMYCGTRKQRRYVRCAGKTFGRSDCAARFTNAAVYEAQVERWVLALPDLSRPVVEPVDLGAARAALAARRRRNAVLFETGDRPEGEYRALAAALVAEEEALPPTATRLRTIGVGIRAAQEAWHEAPIVARNGFLRGILDGVLLVSHEARPLPKREVALLLAAARAPASPRS